MSDFKHIVKESLREAFYTPKKVVNEALFGIRLKMRFPWDRIVNALISKNIRPGEKEYRLTWFFEKNGDGPEGWPENHIDFDKQELEYILLNKKLSKDIGPSYTAKTRGMDMDGCEDKDSAELIFEAEEYHDPYDEYGLDQELIEADKPNRLGCWWMRPNLTFFTALRNGVSDHEMAALIELGRPHPSYPYRELFDRGYLRIVINNTAIIFSTFTKISPVQVRRLYNVCIEENKDLVFDTGGKNDKVIYQRKGNIQESLFLLEESCREIDLWNENKA